MAIPIMMWIIKTAIKPAIRTEPPHPTNQKIIIAQNREVKASLFSYIIATLFHILKIKELLLIA